MCVCFLRLESSGVPWSLSSVGSYVSWRFNTRLVSFFLHTFPNGIVVVVCACTFFFSFFFCVRCFVSIHSYTVGKKLIKFNLFCHDSYYIVQWLECIQLCTLHSWWFLFIFHYCAYSSLRILTSNMPVCYFFASFGFDVDFIFVVACFRLYHFVSTHFVSVWYVCAPDMQSDWLNALRIVVDRWLIVKASWMRRKMHIK